MSVCTNSDFFPPFFSVKSDGLLCLMFLLPQRLCCAQIGSKKVDVSPNEPPPVRKTGFGNTFFLLCFLVFSIKALVEYRALLASIGPVALIPPCEACGKHRGCSYSLGCGVCVVNVWWLCQGHRRSVAESNQADSDHTVSILTPAVIPQALSAMKTTVRSVTH